MMNFKQKCVAFKTYMEGLQKTTMYHGKMVENVCAKLGLSHSELKRIAARADHAVYAINGIEYVSVTPRKEVHQ